MKAPVCGLGEYVLMRLSGAFQIMQMCQPPEPHRDIASSETDELGRDIESIAT